MVDHSDQIEPKFTPRPAGGAVIPFPLNRRRRKIETAARRLEALKTEDGKLRFWNRTVSGLAAELCRHNVDDETVRRELERFHAALSASAAAMILSAARRYDTARGDTGSPAR